MSIIGFILTLCGVCKTFATLGAQLIIIIIAATVEVHGFYQVFPES